MQKSQAVAGWRPARFRGTAFFRAIRGNIKQFVDIGLAHALAFKGWSVQQASFRMISIQVAAEFIHAGIAHAGDGIAHTLQFSRRDFGWLCRPVAPKLASEFFQLTLNQVGGDGAVAFGMLAQEDAATRSLHQGLF